MKILTADDDRALRFKIRALLEKEGYEVVEAADGREAWSLLTGPDPPRIALIDWMMPEMDGVTLCRKLAESRGPDLTYTILLTGRSGKEDLVQALKQGAHDFLSKPVHPGELLSRIEVGRRLVEMHRVRNRLIGVAAHDLRSPLSSIRIMTEMLLDEELAPEDPAQALEIINIIHDAAVDMLGLINNLLDVSAIEAGRLEPDLEDVELGSLIQRRVRLFTANAASKNVSLDTALDDLPAARCDPARISQAVDNLISNAIKYSPRHSAVRVRLSRDGGEALVAVEDSGPGLSEGDRRLVFGEFQRLSARPTAGEGTSGLGLAIVKKIVEAHHGRIGVDDMPGGGSRFYFTLPLVGADNKEGADG